MAIPLNLTSGIVFLKNAFAVAVGSGTASATVGGTLSSSTTAVSTTDLLEDTLASYSLPANTLAVNGRGVRITVTCTFAANANAKTARVYFGSSVVALSTSLAASPSNLTWHAVYTVFRTGAATQYASGLSVLSGVGAAQATSQTPVAPTETLSGAVLIKVTGSGPTTIGDITLTSFLVEAI